MLQYHYETKHKQITLWPHIQFAWFRDNWTKTTKHTSGYLGVQDAAVLFWKT